MNNFRKTATRAGALARDLIAKGFSAEDIANGFITAGLAAWAVQHSDKESADKILEIWASVRDSKWL